MNIFKTFETFFKEPLEIIKNRIIQVIYVEQNIFARHSHMEVDFTPEKINCTVYGSEKFYNLLSSVITKRKLKNENKNSKISA